MHRAFVQSIFRYIAPAAVGFSLLACTTSRPVNIAATKPAPLLPNHTCSLPLPDDSTLVGIEGDVEIASREQKVPRAIMFDLARKLASSVVWTPHPITGMVGRPSMRFPVLTSVGHSVPSIVGSNTPRVLTTAVVGGFFAFDVGSYGEIHQTVTVASSEDSALDAAIRGGIAALDSSDVLAALARALQIARGRVVTLHVTIATTTGPAPSFEPHPLDPTTTSHASWRIAEVWQPQYANAEEAVLERQGIVRAPLGLTSTQFFGTAVIDQRGHPIPATFHTYFGDRHLVDAVRRSLSGWRYRPARIGDCPVRGVVTIGA